MSCKHEYEPQETTKLFSILALLRKHIYAAKSQYWPLEM